MRIHMLLATLAVLFVGTAHADEHADYRSELVKKVVEPCILQVVRLAPEVRAHYVSDDLILVVTKPMVRTSINRMVKATYPEIEGKSARDRAAMFQQYLDTCVELNVESDVAKSDTALQQ